MGDVGDYGAQLVSSCEPGLICTLGRKHLSESRSLWTLIFSLCELLSRGWMDAFKAALCPEDGELSMKRHFPLVFLQVLYEDSQMVTLTAPYIPGFLGFRESPFLLEALQRLKGLYPELMPQVRFLNLLFTSHNSHHKIFCAWTNKYLVSERVPFFGITLGFIFNAVKMEWKPHLLKTERCLQLHCVSRWCHQGKMASRVLASLPHSEKNRRHMWTLCFNLMVQRSNIMEKILWACWC